MARGRGAWSATSSLLVAAGCVSAAGPGEPTTGETVASWDRPVEAPDDAEAATQRAACAYRAGSLPAETQGDSHPMGSQIPVDHIIVVMQENRSFDHYFQMLPQRGQPDVDVAPAGFSNPASDGAPVAIFHQLAPCFSNTSHTWNATHEQIAGGKMDGFVRSNENHGIEVHDPLRGGARAMGYYDDTELPFYYWLANEFSLADRYFCSVPGPTWPNRLYLYAGSSYGATLNVNIKPEVTIFDHLAARGLEFRVYFSDDGGLADFLAGLLPEPKTQARPIQEFFVDAAAGTLPAVSFVNSTLDVSGAVATWEHPPSVVDLGQRFVAEVIAALMKSPQWPRSALFLTYDEHGGLFDHVPPPAACLPDAHEPELQPHDTPGHFDHLGPRVPMIVVSPYAKRHHVSHEVYDHTSILRFIEARFVLPALSGRDANALAPWDMFDFAAAPHESPPAFTLPTVDAGAAARCAKEFPREAHSPRPT